MKTYITTTTNETSRHVQAEILRIDPAAAIQFPQGNPTVLRVRSAKVSAWTLEAIAGVAQVYAEAAT
jgi:hypothetical protein